MRCWTNDNGNGPDQPTPEWIEQNMADTQLAAGLSALLGKLETGEWPTVGQAGADLLAKQSTHANLLRRRERLLEMLGEIDLELAKPLVELEAEDVVPKVQVDFPADENDDDDEPSAPADVP